MFLTWGWSGRMPVSKTPILTPAPRKPASHSFSAWKAPCVHLDILDSPWTSVHMTAHASTPARQPTPAAEWTAVHVSTHCDSGAAAQKPPPLCCAEGWPLCVIQAMRGQRLQPAAHSQNHCSSWMMCARVHRLQVCKHCMHQCRAVLHTSRASPARPLTDVAAGRIMVQSATGGRV